mmetsp:Transcript_99952/g.254269  ORF Transcript_99952/g.254269 Transcript_99952/m.254269 type:complete len:372 (-) Transcript_99952:332-1447(-)
MAGSPEGPHLASQAHGLRTEVPCKQGDHRRPTNNLPPDAIVVPSQHDVGMHRADLRRVRQGDVRVQVGAWQPGRQHNGRASNIGILQQAQHCHLNLLAFPTLARLAQLGEVRRRHPKLLRRLPVACGAAGIQQGHMLVRDALEVWRRAPTKTLPKVVRLFGGREEHSPIDRQAFRNWSCTLQHAGLGFRRRGDRGRSGSGRRSALRPDNCFGNIGQRVSRKNAKLPAAQTAVFQQLVDDPLQGHSRRVCHADVDHNLELPKLGSRRRLKAVRSPAENPLDVRIVREQGPVPCTALLDPLRTQADASRPNLVGRIRGVCKAQQHSGARQRAVQRLQNLLPVEGNGVDLVHYNARRTTSCSGGCTIADRAQKS